MIHFLESAKIPNKSTYHVKTITQLVTIDIKLVDTGSDHLNLLEDSFSKSTLLTYGALLTYIYLYTLYSIYDEFQPMLLKTVDCKIRV